LNILVVRACAVGDFVLNLPALQALRKCYAEAAFTLIGYPATLVLAREFLAVRAIHSIEQAPWNRLFYEPIEALDFDLAIVWMKDPAVAGNLRRAGVPRVLHAAPFPQSGHAADHLLASVGLPAPELPDRWTPAGNHSILHPGSGSPRKNWPHFTELAQSLQSPLFLLGPVESGFDPKPFAHLENLSLPDVTRQLVAARLYVGNDSGITHLAAYLGVPTMAIFTATDPVVWAPVGRRVTVLRNPATVDDVHRACSKWL
jgi:heptosyltransferase III